MRISILIDDTGSSNISSLTYFAQETSVEAMMEYPLNMKGDLYAEFANGAEYHYLNVPLSKFVEVMMSESIGSSFSKVIVKGNFAYEKV